MGGFCLLVELHQEGSVINGATPSSLVSITQQPDDMNSGQSFAILQCFLKSVVVSNRPLLFTIGKYSTGDSIIPNLDSTSPGLAKKFSLVEE